MPSTMKEILQLDILKTCKVLTAHKILSKRFVKGITAIEIPVEDFVQENELVLTTGIGCEHHPEHFFTFVAEVKKSRAAALMIATGKFIHEIPQSIIQFSEQNNFPIIELPWKVRFAEIIKMVLQKLHGWNKVIHDYDYNYTTACQPQSSASSDLVMHQLADHQAIKQMALHTLQPLIHYQQMDLLKTLSTFIKNRGNVSQTARKMNLHRQSLLYRLQKIEQLMERSLDNPNDLFLLDLSLRLYTFNLLTSNPTALTHLPAKEAEI